MLRLLYHHDGEKNDGVYGSVSAQGQPMTAREDQEFYGSELPPPIDEEVIEKGG